MNIQPNSNQPIKSNDPTRPPSDPTNSPIKNMPSDVMGHIISHLNNQEKQEVATTSKPLTNITVDQAKQSSLNEIKELTKNIASLIDKFEETLVDETKIKELKMVKAEILSFQGEKVLGGVNLLDLKASLSDVKIKLANLMNKSFRVNDGTKIPIELKTELANFINKFLETDPVVDLYKMFPRRDLDAPANTTDDILKLAQLYRFKNKVLSEPIVSDFAQKSLIQGLIQAEDLVQAFNIGSLYTNDSGLWDDNFSSLEDKKMPDALIFQLDKVVDEFPESDFKKQSMSFLDLKYEENRKVENENLE